MITDALQVGGIIAALVFVYLVLVPDNIEEEED